jgi:hypothetical protein
MEEVLPSIRKTGQYKLQEQLADAMKNLEIEKKEKEHLKLQLRSETSKLKDQLRKTLDFNQATKKVEPTEYIYIATTSQDQQTNKFKVGGCQSFELVKSRLPQYGAKRRGAASLRYNTGKSDSNNHFFVYLKKTTSYRSLNMLFQEC